MQKFSKYAYHKIINNDNHNTNKIINRPFNHIFLHYQVIQENIHEKCKFLLTDCKPFNILKDYIEEKKHIANEKWKKEKKTFSHINCKNEVTYYRKNNVDNVSISHNLYASLKNIFVLIDKINRFLVVNNLQKCRNISPCRIVEYNVYINERLYLFCLHVPDEFVNETLHEIEKILRDKDFVELCREIKNLNFNELASFFNIYNNIIGKKYNEQCDNNLKFFFFFQDVEKFILQNLCISIHNIITNANNKIINNENISKKYSSSNKINFHRMYMEILSILNVLKNNNKLYVNFIDFILFIQFKAVYKHNHHYNYSYSINLIQVIHKVLFSQLNYLYTTKPYEEEEFIYENFFTVLNDNYFYIEKEKFTWNYIEKYYEDIKPYRSLRTTSLGSSDIKKKNVDLDEDTDEMEKNEKKIISKINRNINFLTSEIILTFSNYTTSSPYSCNDISCNDDMTTIYMSYIFNDLYFQNNHKIIKFVFSYFLKHFKDINSVLKLNKINVYFQYITIYNFLKLFKNEVNKPSTEYHNVLKMFMECFDNNLYHKVNEDSSFNNIHDSNSDGIFYVDIKIEQYLHFLNKLWYFYFLSKKLITNCEFLSHFNYHFYLTFHMINQYVQKYMNNSELFTIFVNKCINKITGILVIQKYFNIYIEEDLIKHLSKIIYLAHNIISRENKRKILMYIPFIKQPKRNMDNLKIFLIDKELAQNGVNNILLNNYKKDELHIYKCEKEEKRISFVQQVKSNICEEGKKTNFNHNPCNDYEQYEKCNLNEMLLYLGCKKKNIAQIIEKLEKNKNYKINNNELYELLSEHMKESILIKKENVILKNKLNYIVLNFEKFISSYVSGIVSNKSLFMKENGYNHMNSTGCNNIVGKMEECNSILKGEYNTKEGNEMVVVNDDENPHNISIKFDYHQVKVKNEYFYELKKYENQSNIKINNILINMYMYNPHICAKNKNSFISKHKTKQKKMIILPYDTYKNIKKLVIYNDYESVNLFKRLNNSIYLFFLKMKFFFNKTN
ncbi:conserved Plasmodium protein, unknown function [Plasmodium malariae]|uniref:Uncharacterized protein n=1 Tax=Plasmodium malariae TaxID=5858 RepID=A0A1C3KYW1_PLAMA|nr:conserved Plasmodium protein, unknown function [Plasmodium malariae]